MSRRPDRRLLADLTPLRVSPPYRRIVLGATASGIGAQLTTVAVGLQVYDLTASTFAVGLVGLFALVPLVLAGLYGGSVVDAFDRRRVVIVASTGMLVASVLLAAQAALGLDQLWLVYLLVALQNVFYPVNNSARSTITPRLIAPELLPAANALNGLLMGLSLTVGPLLAGVLVGAAGFATAYGLEAVMLVAALLLVAGLPSLPPEGDVRRFGVRSVLEGLRYLGTRPNVRMTFLVDLAAMILAMPRVLWPAIAVTVLGGGATTVGVLSAGFAAGALLAGVFSGPLGSVRRQGRAVIGAVWVYAAAVAVFGLVIALAQSTGRVVGWAIVPAVAALMVAGAADSVSGVFRNTILQAATPDSMRGRLQGVFIVVVAGGPRLGDLVLGSVAEATREAVAAIAGGLACVVVVALLALRWPGFARYDARSPTP